MPIQFTDSKSGIKKRRGRKAALPGYYACLSRDLLLMASGADTHTHIHQHSWTKRFQETRHARPSASRAWFNNTHFNNYLVNYWKLSVRRYMLLNAFICLRLTQQSDIIMNIEVIGKILLRMTSWIVSIKLRTLVINVHGVAFKKSVARVCRTVGHMYVRMYSRKFFSSIFMRCGDAI